MKRSTLTVTIKLDEHAYVQASVSIPACYPDAVAEGKATVLGMVRELLAERVRGE